MKILAKRRVLRRLGKQGRMREYIRKDNENLRGASQGFWGGGAQRILEQKEEKNEAISRKVFK